LLSTETRSNKTNTAVCVCCLALCFLCQICHITLRWFPVVPTLTARYSCDVYWAYVLSPHFFFPHSRYTVPDDVHVLSHSLFRDIFM